MAPLETRACDIRLGCDRLGGFMPLRSATRQRTTTKDDCVSRCWHVTATKGLVVRRGMVRNTATHMHQATTCDRRNPKSNAKRRIQPGTPTRGHANVHTHKSTPDGARDSRQPKQHTINHTKVPASARAPHGRINTVLRRRRLWSTLATVPPAPASSSRPPPRPLQPDGARATRLWAGGKHDASGAASTAR